LVSVPVPGLVGAVLKSMPSQETSHKNLSQKISENHHIVMSYA